MLRYRRRFLLIAVIATIALYHFANLRAWEGATPILEDLRHSAGQIGKDINKLPGLHIDQPLKDTDDAGVGRVSDIPADHGDDSKTHHEFPHHYHDDLPEIGQKGPDMKPVETPTESPVSKPAATPSKTQNLGDEDVDAPLAPKLDDEETTTPANPDASPVSSPPPKTDQPVFHGNEVEKPPSEVGQGRMEIPSNDAFPPIYWTKQPEHFPVPTESLIPLPTGKPKSIPRIQHDFAAESPSKRTIRLDRLKQVKDAFIYSWAGYREKAWMADELSPVSGGYRNPFCGWAATLVDSLDTLYIMGMDEEFEEAVRAVKDLDFTTTKRQDIPLFETTIRYLGGLIGAYDISGNKHRILLDKAVELAEVLMGSFDTPNRMPITYYHWKP
jgi:mannosyl-oligosaccharide alpha-1,2-mannosidase